jgi:hypothetical protein
MVQVRSTLREGVRIQGQQERAQQRQTHRHYDLLAADGHRKFIMFSFAALSALIWLNTEDGVEA